MNNNNVHQIRGNEKNYIFLLSKNKYEDSNIRNGKDLLTQFQKEDDDVFAIHITTTKYFETKVIKAFGFQQAFFDGCFCIPNKVSSVKITHLTIPLKENSFGILNYNGWYPKLEKLYKLEI